LVKADYFLKARETERKIERDQKTQKENKNKRYLIIFTFTSEFSIKHQGRPLVEKRVKLSPIQKKCVEYPLVDFLCIHQLKSFIIVIWLLQHMSVHNSNLLRIFQMKKILHI
jgi:hypothetical protein